jgi:hypothetical protein
MADRSAADRQLLRHINEYPLDCLAVSVALPTIAFSGLAQPIESSWALVDHLGEFYGDDWWFTGIRAFTRQEQRRWSEADSLASRSLREEPASGHAAHACTHVFYETGDHGAGLEWLDRWISANGAATNHRAHYSWHAALHELALDNPAAARRRYFVELAPPAVTGARALVDSASLLWRLRMQGEWSGELPIDDVLATVDACVFDRPATLFAALHAVIGMAAAGDEVGIGNLARFAHRHPDPAFDQMVSPLCQGFSAVISGRPADAVEPLRRVTAELPRFGGSAAQQEIVTETLLHALLGAGQHDAARSLIAERLDRRQSPSDRRRLIELC